ncbi:hypothetical protein Tsubulata_046375, partial [Turnera subulata]
MATTPTHIVPNLIKVLTDLEADTYENWKACMTSYLVAQDLWDVIVHYSDDSFSEEANGDKDWRKKNAAALLAIQTTCGPNILAMVRHIPFAKLVWETLAGMKEQVQVQGALYYEELLPQGLEFLVDHVPRLSVVWTAEEYQNWSIQMRTYLTDSGLWDGIIEVPNEPNGGSPVIYNTWREKNFTALHAIRASFSSPKTIQASFVPLHIPGIIKGVTSAKTAWDNLATLNQFKQQGIPADASLPEPSTAETKKPKQQYCGLLLAAIDNGDWYSVEKLLDEGKISLTTPINREGEAPIHAAIMAKQWNITRNLIALMSEKELEVRTKEGATTLHLAACTQQIGIVECLIAKNKKLVQVQVQLESATPSEMALMPRYPVTVGCFASSSETTRYLYNRTPIQLLYPECGNEGYLLFQFSIYNEMF